MVSLGFKSNTGLRRSKNEDALFVMPKEDVYVVADGVGGSNSGEVASKVAVTHIAELIKENPINTLNTDGEVAKQVLTYIESANEKIVKMGEENIKLKGMATTLVVLAFKGSRGYIFNVGDSRAYIYKNNQLAQITEDHSYVNSLVKMGVITEEEGVNHEGGHMITRAIGADVDVEPDLFIVDIEEEDVIILCTDGLYDEVSEDVMVKLIEENDSMSNLAEELVEEANRAGGNDNITVVCVKI